MGALAAVVLAAGKGKRIAHPTLPKVLLPLRGRPVLAYVLEAVGALQPEHLFIVVGFRGEQVAAWVRAQEPRATIVWQGEQLGTGHAVMQTEPLLRDFPGDVLIVTGDTPLVRAETLREFVRQHRRAEVAVSVLSAQCPEPTGYGRLLRDEQGAVVRIIEESDATPAERQIREVNTGILLAQAPVLFALLPLLSRQNAQQEYYLTDVVALCRQYGYRLEAWCAPDWDEFHGINTWEDLARVERRLEQLSVGVGGS